MSKRAPALGRKVKPGPIEHLPPPSDLCLYPRLPIYGTYVAPTQTIPLETDERAVRLAEDPGD